MKAFRVTFNRDSLTSNSVHIKHQRHNYCYLHAPNSSCIVVCKGIEEAAKMLPEAISIEEIGPGYTAEELEKIRQ